MTGAEVHDEPVPVELDDPNSAEAGADPSAGSTGARATDSGIMRSSAVMGIGTVSSRISGVVRGAALAAAIGVAGPVADIFALGNTVPNIVYILVVGGALNAVFVPQLVRHMHSDADRGGAFTDRLLTVTLLVLLTTTIVAVLAAPWIVSLYSSNLYTPQQTDLAILITRLCLPQIIFYGLFTMLAQVLNARGHFAVPMFAPIINNVLSVAAFIAFFVIWGTEPERSGTLSAAQALTLGLGATLGVVGQAVALLPVLRRTGYHYRPRFDLRGSGLGHAGSLASWTIGLVLANQLGYVVIVRLLTAAGASASSTAGATEGGLAIYQSAHLVFMLPHSIITVSLVTAMMPRMSAAAAQYQLGALAGYVASGARTAAAAVVLAAAGLVVLGPALADLLFGYGAARNSASVTALGNVVSVFALGLLPFTFFYVILRGWYALETTRTAFVATVLLNIVNVALALTAWAVLTASGRSGADVVLSVAAAYVAAYWVTAAGSWWWLRRRLGHLQTRATASTLVRLVAAGLAACAAMLAIRQVLVLGLGLGKPATLAVVVLTSLVGLLVYLGVARLLRVQEIADVLALLRRRGARPA